MLMERLIKNIVIHCSDSQFGCALLIDRWHKERGFNMIGYHYLIGAGYPYATTEYDPLGDGTIEYGRSPDSPGAHVGHVNRNHDTLGVCLIGRNHFTTSQFESLKSLLLWLIRSLSFNGMSLSPESVIGHYELDNNKTCPNIKMDHLRRFIATKNYRRHKMALLTLTEE